MSGIFTARGLRSGFPVATTEGGGGEPLRIGDLSIPRGRVTAVVGVSGSGKSTLLNFLGGLAKPERDGAAPALAFDIDDDVRYDLLGGRRPFPAERVAFIFQDGHFITEATVRQNLTLARRAAKLPVVDAALMAALAAAELPPGPGAGADDAERAAYDARLRSRLNDPVSRLSGGERQRLGIARAFAREPNVILADEPTSNIDPKTAREITDLFGAWCAGAEDRAVVMVTHDYGLAARAEHLIVLREGAVVYDGPRLLESEIALKVYGDPAQKPRASWKQTRPQRRRAWLATEMLDGLRLGLSGLFGSTAVGAPGFFLTRHGDKLLLLTLLFATLMFCIGVSATTLRYFDEERRNPFNTHVVVGGDLREPEYITVTRALLERDAAGLLEGYAGPPEDAPRFFGRRNVESEPFVWGATDADAEAARDVGRYADILRIDRNEPIMRAIDAFPVGAFLTDGPTPCEGGPAAPLGSAAEALDPGDVQQDHNKILVTAAFMRDLRERVAAPATADRAQAVVRIRRSARVLEIAGVICQAPPAREAVFEAVITLDLNLRMLQDAGTQYDNLMDGNTFAEFTQAVVYFSAADFSRVERFLASTGFEFDRGNFARLGHILAAGDRIATQLRLLLAVVVIAISVSVVVQCVGVLQSNRKPALVLKAHGARSTPITVSGFTQIAFVAAAALAAGYGVAAAGLSAFGEPAFSPDELLEAAAEVVGAPVSPSLGYFALLFAAALFVVMRLLTALFLTMRARSSLANDLRSDA